MAKTYRTPSVAVLGDADALTLGFHIGNKGESMGGLSTSESLLDL